MAIDTPWKIIVEDASHGVQAEYLPILVQRNPAPTDQSAVQVGTNRPANAVNFSLSAQLESGSLEWDAYQKNGEDFSNGTLQNDSGTGVYSNVSTAEQNRLDARFSEGPNGNLTVTTITEQRIWVKEYIHDAGLASEWKLEGPSWDDRVNLNEGTPVFINGADIEPDPNRPFEGRGRIQFQLGGRL